MKAEEWTKLIEVVDETSEWFPDGLAYIGGIAVYAHLISKDGSTSLFAYTHDADFVMLLHDFQDLRDLEMVTPNRRLEKHEFSKGGFSFDVYVEHQNGLKVPVDELIAFSELKSGMRVISPEHLLKLKIVAWNDRKGTVKGSKDEDDLIRILTLLDNPRPEILTRLEGEEIEQIAKIVKGDAPVRVVHGNLHKAKSLRQDCNRNMEALKHAFHSLSEPKEDTPGHS